MCVCQVYVLCTRLCPSDSLYVYLCIHSYPIIVFKISVLVSMSSRSSFSLAGTSPTLPFSPPLMKGLQDILPAHVPMSRVARNARRRRVLHSPPGSRSHNTSMGRQPTNAIPSRTIVKRFWGAKTEGMRAFDLVSDPEAHHRIARSKTPPQVCTLRNREGEEGKRKRSRFSISAFSHDH